MKSVWVITEEHNDYDQHGVFFCCVFKNKPTQQNVLSFFWRMVMYKSINLKSTKTKWQHS